MSILRRHRERGFTLVESLSMVAVLVILVALVVSLRAKYHQRPGTVHCMNYLMQIGVASRIWQDDHQGHYPMDVPVSLGGARELVATGNVAACFQVMSNELATPLVLACPNDPRVQPATNWNGNFNRLNISYFVGLTVTNVNSPSVLAGDDNLVQDGRAVSSGRVNLENSSVTWTKDRHGGAVSGFGNILLPDGAVRNVLQMGLVSMAGSCYVTNSVVIP